MLELKELSYKNYITTSYGKNIYSLTQQLQCQKVKLANSKNQLNFLDKCITNKIIPKFFQVKSPILFKKGKMLQEEYQMKLLKLARNEAKQRMYKSRSNIVTYLNVLKEQLCKGDYDTLIAITDNTKEKHFIKKKEHLISKYKSLINKNEHFMNLPNETSRSIVKEGIVNLTGEELDENKIKLLNLGPKFVPTKDRTRPYMDITQTAEICALDLEREGKFSIAESLRQNISRIITKDLKKKHKNNLSFAERKALTEMQLDKNISIYPFDKGTGFVVIKEKDAIQKIEEQIGKSEIIYYDPTPTLLNKFQKELLKLRKENKFDSKTYFKLYPSDAIPPQLY